MAIVDTETFLGEVDDGFTKIPTFSIKDFKKLPASAIEFFWFSRDNKYKYFHVQMKEGDSYKAYFAKLKTKDYFTLKEEIDALYSVFRK